MKGTKDLKVKTCCIASIEEASMAIKFGASAIGLVGEMPSGPGIIKKEQIKDIAQSIPSEISSFLLTSETSSSRIIEQIKFANTTSIQIVDKLTEGSYQDIREELPHIEIVQVIHVLDEASIKEAIEVAAFVDYILLDSGNPNLKTKILGGTGKTHNWELSRRIRAAVPVPIYLAGGLNSHNVQAAIKTVQPFGLDLCSGVRTNSKLDKEKLSAFFEAMNSIN